MTGEKEPENDGEMSLSARLFAERDLASGTLLLGVVLIGVVFGGAVASFFIRLDGDMTLARAIARIFLGH